MTTIGDQSVAGGVVTLRPWRPADVAFVYDACQDPELQRWVPIPRPYTAADAVAFLWQSERGRHSNAEALFAITVTDTGELVGSIALTSIDWHERRSEVGYWLAAEARGRGLGAAALAAVTEWAGSRLDLRQVWLRIAPANDASRRLAERAGFVLDGVDPGGAQDADGWVDALVFRRPTAR